MTRSSPQQRDTFACVRDALQASVAVPTDTFITDDMPLLLTKLSQLPQLPPAGPAKPRD